MMDWLAGFLVLCRAEDTAYTNMLRNPDRLKVIRNFAVDSWKNDRILLDGAVQVFTYSDVPVFKQSWLCDLARSVERAGGTLRVLGLRDGMPIETDGSKQEVRDDFDTSAYLRRHRFAYNALRVIPNNATIVLVDAFDTLFQETLEEMLQRYERMSAKAVEKYRRYPVIFGGEMNCWPFPHRETIPVRRGSHTWIYRLRRAAHLSPNEREHPQYNSNATFGYNRRGGRLHAKSFCREWLRSFASMRVLTGEGPHFPFLNAGSLMGRAGAVRRLYWHFFRIYKELRHHDDQLLLSVLLLQKPELGFVDVQAELFLSLHGHSSSDLTRPICAPGYFSMHGFRVQPATFTGNLAHAAAVLHFNGNGKRFQRQCAREFLSLRITLTDTGRAKQCIVYNNFMREGKRFTWMLADTEGTTGHGA